MASLIRPPYGSHSGSRHACQKRPTSQCGWARRAAAQTVVAQRVQGAAGDALLRDRGNKSLRRRLSEYAPSRGSHKSATLVVWGATQGPGLPRDHVLSGETCRQGSVRPRKKQRSTPPSFAGLAARTDAAQGINRQRRLKEEKRLTLPNACGKKDNTEASSGSGWMYKRCTLRAGSKLHPLMPENGEASVLPAGGAYLA